MLSLYNLDLILSLRKIGNIMKPIMVVFLSFSIIGENYGF